MLASRHNIFLLLRQFFKTAGNNIFFVELYNRILNMDSKEA